VSWWRASKRSCGGYGFVIREEFTAATTSNLAGERMVFDALAIDLSRREVSFQGVVHHLKPKEFDLLVFLARNRGIVFESRSDPGACLGLGI
jgi:DNA-binding response OmpR family regulator